jgi:flagellar assembly factor FliW
MEKIYIPIGFQCTVPTVLAKAGLKGETLPFDWLLNTPEFVYTIISKLVSSDVNIDKLVREEFFKCDSKTILKRHANNQVNVEHFEEVQDGELLYNTLYGVIFPHDHLDEQNVQKYIRRFERLRNLIFDQSKEICFLYISQSSNTDGNFTINNEFRIRDTYRYLTNLYDLILSIRDNFSMIVMDSIQSEDSVLLDKTKIKYITINPKPVWLEIVDQCVEKLIN